MKYEFTCNNFTNVCKFVNCQPYDNFKKMYAAVFGEDNIVNSYVSEKFNIATNDFSRWFCSLDEDIQVKVLNFVEYFYKRNGLV